MTRKYAAFTLVELLVVIGIIAVLIALLLPALGRARQAALTVECLSNLRQCAMAVQEYAADNQEMVPVEEDGETSGAIRLWPAFLYGFNVGGNWTGTPYLKDTAVRLCPANEYYADDIVGQTITSSTGWAGTNVGYGMYNDSAISGGNGGDGQFQIGVTVNPNAANPLWLEVQNLARLTTPGFGWFQDDWRGMVYQSDYGPSSQTAMLGDSCEGANGHNGAILDKVDGGNFYASSVDLIHQGRANVVFYDGHAENMTDTQLNQDIANPLHYFYETDGTYEVLP